MRTIIITGAAGFIGYHLAKALHQRGDKVIGYDNFNSYYLQQLKRDRAALLLKLGIPVIEGDISDVRKITEMVETLTPTHLVHLAAQAGVRYSLESPHSYIQTNIEGFFHILELCRKFPTIKLLYASSSSVYGNSKNIPFSTDDPVNQQASLYGVTKKTNELMASTYANLFGFSAIGLRYFTVYGPWGRPDMAYFSFADAIMKDQPITLFENGKPARDFTHIDDIVSGTINALDCPSPSDVYNLGSHRPIPVLDLLKNLEKSLGKKAIIQHASLPQGDVPMTFADISQTKKELGYNPKMRFDEGIEQFCCWYLQYFSLCK